MSRLDRVARRVGLDPRALLGVAVLLGGLVLWGLTFTNQLANLFSSSTTTIKADFQSVEDIVSNDPVRINGVQVGTVSGVSADPGGRGATLTFNLDSTAGKIYRNASASILWRTALGANDAVALDPGTPAAGPLGSATIPMAQDSNQVELDQVTSAFHGPAQQGMRTMLQQLSPALSAHPALGQDLSILSRIAPDAAVGINALRGQNQDTDLRNLVRNASRAAQAIDIGTNASQTQQFVESAANTLTAVSDEQTPLKQTLQGLASDLPLLTTTFASTNGFDHDLTVLDPLLAKLTPEVTQVGPTLSDLHPTLTDLHNLLTDATPLLRKLRPAVDSLAHTAQVGVPVLDNVAPALNKFANSVLPGLAEKNAEEGGRPAYDEIGPVFVGIGTLADSYNQDGNFANLTAGALSSNAQQLLPCTVDFTGTDFLVCETLSQALADFYTGGSPLLQNLARRPGGAKIFGPLARTAQQLNTGLTSTKDALSKIAPAVENLLFKRPAGVGR